MKNIAVLLSLGVLLTVSCVEREQESQSINVSFTPCQQSKLRNSSELSGKVDVEFTDKGVQITHHGFEVTCDFTTVNVSHTLLNGVLNITQQGSPNQAKCICYTDVSYTINGISQNEVNVIFINGLQVYCYNENLQERCNCIMDTLKGEWSWKKRYGGYAGITTDNEFKSIVKIKSQNEDTSINYEVFVEDTLFYKGNFQIQYDQWNHKYATVTITLPHHTYGGWIMYFEDFEGILEEPFLIFAESGVSDGYEYYYQKIR